MSEYTPTTADIRHGYIVTSMRYTPETDDHLLAKRRREVADEFDRWLAQERAAARREGQSEGWDEAHADGCEYVIDRACREQHPNPYRQEADQ